MKKNKLQGPKVLLFDVETAPILAWVWGLFDQNIGLNQIKKDWHILSWSAKWLHKPKIYYADQRNAKVIHNDKKLLQGIWKLLDEADIVITQNGKRFDVKKLNARFIIHGMQPPSSFRHIDTLELAKRHFAFTSNKLEYMSNALDTQHKKLTKRKFDGFDLWKECLAGNKSAWREMEKYNKRDVTTLAQVYERVIPWDSTINFSAYHDGEGSVCTCGSTQFVKNGFAYKNKSVFQKYRCVKCGSETRSSQNLFDKDKRASLRVKV